MKQIAKFHAPRRTAIGIALAAALPALFASQPAAADCTPNPVSLLAANATAGVTVVCNNSGAGAAGANVIVSDTTTYVDATNAGGLTRATGGGIFLQFDGHGRTLTVNAGAELGNYRNVAGTRTAVTMGAPTRNAAATTTFATAPAAGNTVVTLSAGPAPDETWVGQSLVLGRWSPNDGGDFLTGQAYVISAVDVANRTVTLATPLGSGFAGTGDSTLPIVYAVVSNYGAGTARSWSGPAAGLFGDSAFYNNVISNSGLIGSRVQLSELVQGGSNVTAAAPYNSAIYGLRTSVAGSYLVDNKSGGTLRVSHAGIGAAYAVEEGGTVERMDVHNAGTIEALRTQGVTLAAVTATGNPTGTSAGLPYAATTIGLVNAINTQEEAQHLNIFNTGTLRSAGDYTGTLYMRAEEKRIVNRGTIEQVSSTGTYDKGFAIGSVSNGGEIRELNIDNQAGGVIRGDILAVNGNALRWYLLSTQGTTAGSNTLGSVAALAAGRDARLTINSHTGQEDSEISNAGTITGNLWLSNGRHQLVNTGTLTGNIDVDQRNTSYGTVSGATISVLPREDGSASYNSVQGGLYTIRGDKTFSLVNTNTITGNLRVENASASFTPTVGSARTVHSSNQILNAGTFTGNIAFTGVTPDSRNSVTLLGNGFTGNLTATRAGNDPLEAETNVLNLGNTGTLRGDVAGFTRINVGGFTVEGAPSGDDDDVVSDGPSLPAIVKPAWTIAAGRTVGSDSTVIHQGSLNVLGTLQSALSVASGATLAGNGSIAGNITSAGTIDAGSGTLSVTGDVQLQSGSVLASTVAANGAAGKLAITGALGFANGASVKPTAASGYRITDGAQYTLATATSITGTPTLVGNGLITWQSTVQNNAFTVTAQVGARNLVGLSGNAATALDAAVAAGGTLAERLLSLPNEAAVRRAADQLKPDAGGGTVVGALSASSAVSGVIGGRSSSVQVASLLRQSGVRGVATGDAGETAGVWFQGFGFTGSQQARGGQAGYGVNSAGFAAGVDELVDAQTGLRVGGALSVASTSLDTQTGIGSYQASLYGSREFDTVYLSGETSLGRHEYTSNRVVLGQTASASYGGLQLGARAEAGMPLVTDAGVFVPLASLSVSHLGIDGYTERGAAGALSVEATRIRSVRSGVGGKWLLPLGGFAESSSLELRALWSRELGDARFDTTARFAAGGAAFKTAGVEQPRDSLLFGAAIRLLHASGTTRQSLLVGYGGEARSGYLSHTGYVQGRVDF